MNQIATTRAGTVARPLSEALTLALHLAETGGLKYGVLPEAVTEARELLHRAQIVAPATAEAVLDWLRPIALAVANGPAAEEARARAETVALACADLPAGLFSREAATAALQRWKYWPSASEVRELVGHDYLARKRLLEAVAHAPGAPPIDGPHERTAEEIAAVTATMTAWRAERAARKAAEPRPEKLKVQPSYLTPAQLAAVRAGGKVGERVA